MRTSAAGFRIGTEGTQQRATRPSSCRSAKSPFPYCTPTPYEYPGAVAYLALLACLVPLHRYCVPGPPDSLRFGPRMPGHRGCLVALLAGAALYPAGLAQGESPAAADHFEKQVRPLLVRN